MKKGLITILIIIGFILFIFISFVLGFKAGVRSVRKEEEKIQESLQDEIRHGNGVMLEITNQSTMCEGEELTPAVFSIMIVEYSGYTYLSDADHHNSIVRLSDEDMLSLYRFCKDAYDNGTFDDYSETILDGSTYTYTFYDKDGSEHVIYDGYCYDNPELKGVRELINSYYE